MEGEWTLMHNDLKDSLDYIFNIEKLHESKTSFGSDKPLKINKWIPTIVSMSIVVVAILLFLPIVTDHSTNVNLRTNTLDTKTVSSEIFNLKGTYIGDNSSVGKIISYSMDGQSFNGFQLYTSNEPFGLRIFMENTMDEPINDYDLLISTASYLFTLVRNIEFVEFEYKNNVYTIEKDVFELTFGLDYFSIKDEETFHSLGILKDISNNYFRQLITITPKE